MAIKRKKITRVSSPPKTYISIVPEDGASVKQTVHAASGEVYPDRRLTPLVLTPVVGYKVAASGEQSDNAAPLLTDGHWYRLSKSTGSTGPSAQTEITNGMALTGGIAPHTSRYEIDSTPGSATYGRIRIYENADPADPPTYLFTARLSVAGGAVIAASFRTPAVAVDTLPALYFDNATEGIYNPWEDSPQFSIHPRINPASYQAYYNWESYHDGAWAALFSTPYDWAITRDGNGVTIDRSSMQSLIRLRCIASINVGGTIHQEIGYVTHSRRLPWFEFDWYGIAGIAADVRTLHPRLKVTCNRADITKAADLAQLIINWYGSGSSPIATGPGPDIPVSALGADMDLGLSVSDRGGHKLLVSGDGACHYVTDDGKELIVQAPD